MPDGAMTFGVHHIGLTVPNLAETRAFFSETLNFEPVGEIPDYPAVFLSDGTTMITLWQVGDPANAIAFDRKNNVGLHHLALKLASPDALQDLYHKLDSTRGVDVEFAPEPLGGSGARHMMCFIPGGVRVEFIATGS